MRIALVTVCQCEIGRMPIGILCLHAWIRHHLPQHEIHIVDAGFVNPLDVILNEDWDLVGISSMTPEYETATDLAKKLKKQKPKLPIIIGGQHITALPKSLRNCFDLGIMGEGEATFAEIIESGIGNLSQIKGIVWHGPDGVVVNPGREPISLEGYPHLHYDAIDQRYFESHAIPLFARFGVEGVVMSSRGCPYRCRFCASGHFHRSIRFFPVDWVIEEIQNLAAKGVRFIEFFDDVFAVNFPRVKHIAEEIRRLRLHETIEFYANGKADILDDKMCQILRSMNLNTLFFGLESGSERVLNYLKCAKVTMQDNRRSVMMALEHGFRVFGNVIIGSPPETVDDIRQTVNFINWCWRMGAARITASVLTPYPGTPIWDEAVSMGRVSDNMDFSLLMVDIQKQGLGGFVSKLSPDVFIAEAKKVLAAIHKFKWRKFWEFMMNDPKATIVFMLHAPWSLFRRMFVPTSV